MSASFRCCCLLSLGLVPAFAGPMRAQVRLSERGSVSQTIDGTVITVDYARPQVRGRKTIFGGFVHWKEVWTPGANLATTLQTNRPIKLDGHAIAPGKYSVWFKVEPAQWTMVLDTNSHLYHTEPPDSTAGQMRWIVHPGEGPFTEILDFSFAEVRPTGGTLQLRWGTTSLAMKIEVEPKHPLTIAESDAAPYLGTWRLHWKEDSAGTPGMQLRISREKGVLFAHATPEFWPGAKTIQLIRAGDDLFLFGTLEKGVLTDVMTEMVFDFSRSGDTATRFDIRDERDNVLASGERSER